MKKWIGKDKKLFLLTRFRNVGSNLVQYDSYLILQGENTAAPR